MQKVTMESGEHRPNRTRSTRTYFFYVTPTGSEMSLRDCHHLKKRESYNAQTENNGRVFKATYELDRPIRLKLVSLSSQFGKPNENYNVYIDLDENSEYIELEGLNGFGRIVCRGIVNLKKSVKKIGKITGMTKVNKEDITERLGLKVLKPAIKPDNPKVRKLIF